MNGDTITATNNNEIEIYKDTTDASAVLDETPTKGRMSFYSRVYEILVAPKFANIFFVHVLFQNHEPSCDQLGILFFPNFV